MRTVNLPAGKLKRIGEAIGAKPYNHSGVVKYGGGIATALDDQQWLDVGVKQFGENLNKCAYCENGENETGYLDVRTLERLARYNGFENEQDIMLFANCDLNTFEEAFKAREHLRGELPPLATQSVGDEDLQLEDTGDGESRIGVHAATLHAFVALGQHGPTSPLIQLHMEPFYVLRGVRFGFGEARLHTKRLSRRGEMVDRYARTSNNEPLRLEIGDIHIEGRGTNTEPQWVLTPREKGEPISVLGAEFGPLGRLINVELGDEWEIRVLTTPGASTLVFEDEDSVLPEDKTQIIENFVGGRLLQQDDQTIELREAEGLNLLCRATLRVVRGSTV